MIRYHLCCDADHSFESWFPSSAAYDDQVARGLLSCPICGSHAVSKALMAPAVARKDRDTGGAPVPHPTTPESTPGERPDASFAAFAEPQRRLRALFDAVREHVTRNAEDVGQRFPDEARAMHFGDAPTKAIYGEASLEEARALIEEGIEIAPLPPSPSDRH